jgi:gamma-glutamylcyclotransferase
VVLYFAYASNLSKKQMLSLCPDAKPMFPAVLPNYKLVFTGWSRTYRGGLATIKPFRGEKVWGAIYELSEAGWRRLDRWETGYTRLNVTVFDEDNRAVPAVTYVKSGQLEETMPSREYGEIIRQGYRDWGIG